ncbi:enkurin [Tribolium madens]|uniref:enkurin n=1 Tax=Tribolium madens TaxID=41895 RepID=UPI001CF766A4|nr:enkurin [Tribolium madens]
MSIIAITHHDENINNIISKPEYQYEGGPEGFKTRMYARLKAAPRDTQAIKRHATMGLAQEPPPDPCDFLKKNSGKLSYSQNQTKEKPIKQFCQRKQRLFPTKEDIVQYNNRKKEEAKKEKNFISANIKTVLTMKAKEPEPKVVLEPHGESKRLTDGLEPIYIKSSAFGKTPEYLQSLIKKREKLHQMQKDARGVEKPKCRYIRRDEREELLQGLKHNWEELQKQYQGLPILTDTIPKINRKSKLEAELKQLEKDIVLVERHPYIYVYDDNILSVN